MSDIDIISSELRKNITNFIVPVQTATVINEDAFEELNKSAIMLAKTLKGTELIPKSLLKELLVTFRILYAEASYIKEHAEQLESMAAQLETIFNLIIFNECPDDRKPGVPRIT